MEREKQANERQIAAIRESEMQRSNETLRILSQASAPEGRPTLSGLLEDERRDFSVTSSETLSDEEAPEWLTRKTPTGRVRRTPGTDWSDDDERTAMVSPSASKPRGSNPP